MNKPTPKQAALAAISVHPEETSFEEIAYRVHLLEAIRGGEADIEAGRTVPHEEVAAELEKWLER